MRWSAVALWSAGAIALGAGIMIVLARSAGPTTAAATSAAVRLPIPIPMSVEVGGTATPLRDGEPIAVAKGVIATMTLLPAGNGQHTLEVHLRDGAGTPITDATLRAMVEMRFMEHGQASFVGLPAGASGSYVLPIGFEMPGQWRINLIVTTASATGMVHLEVDEFR